MSISPVMKGPVADPGELMDVYRGQMQKRYESQISYLERANDKIRKEMANTSKTINELNTSNAELSADMNQTKRDFYRESKTDAIFEGLRAKVSSLMNEQLNLMSNKIRIDVELNTYRKLLEASNHVKEEAVSKNTSINSSMNSSMDVTPAKISLFGVKRKPSDALSDSKPSNKLKMPKLSEEDRLKREAERREKEAEKQRQKDQKEEERIKKENEKKEKEAERIRLIEEKEKERLKRESEKKEKEAEKLRQKEEKEEERIKKENERKEKEAEKLRQKEEKEAEKQKKIEEKQAIDDAKKKAEEKSKSIMRSFFKKAPKADHQNDSESKSDRDYCEDYDYDGFFAQINQNVPKEDLYLAQLRRGDIRPKVLAPRKDDKVAGDDNELDDVILLNVDNELPFADKRKPFNFLQFSHTIRPAWFGPYPSRPAKKITPRNPFAKEDFLDYEYESEYEWDEDGPGENLSDSDPEAEEKDDLEDSEDEDGFFVPHGYLSDDEIENCEVENGDSESGEFPHERSAVDEATKSMLKERLQMKDTARLAKINAKRQKKLKIEFISCLWDGTPEVEKEKEKFEFLKTFSITPIVC